jgi:hypothetical protein
MKLPKQPKVKVSSFERRIGPEVDLVREELASLGGSDSPVIAGPFTGEVGFELLYWIPLLRWAAAEFPGLGERLVIVSRGGVEQWLSGIGGRYVDLLDLYSIDEFVRRRPSLKQRERIPFEEEVYERVAQRLGLGAFEVLHPQVLFNLYYRIGKLDQHAFARSVRTTPRGLEGLAALFAPLPRPDRGGLPELPADDYVAIRFYFRPSFPDDEENRRFAADAIRALATRSPVVVLNNRLELDEHRDFDPSGNVVTLDHRMTPATNLDVQTTAIAHAKAFVGTYGGLAYLAPFFGVPSLSFSTQPEHTQPWHADLAQTVFADPNFGTCLSLRPRELALVDLVARDLLEPGVDLR